MRREWIEILPNLVILAGIVSLPPCGGSGLKYRMTFGAVYRNPGLPPCGGSGLKLVTRVHSVAKRRRLPPCGGSGLKCILRIIAYAISEVSLHAEGVD